MVNRQLFVKADCMTFNVSPDSKSENKYILQEIKQNQTKVSFKGFESAGNLINSAFSQIQTGEMAGPAIVDIVSMVGPRTLVDSTRSKDAGLETGLRESFAFVNNCILPGFIAGGAGWLLGKFINKDVKAPTALPVNSETLDLFHNFWKNINGHKFWEEGADKKAVIQEFYEHILNKTEGLVGKDWVKLGKQPENKIKAIASEAAELSIRAQKASGKDLKFIEEKLVNLLGASENLKIIDGEKTIETTANKLIKSMHNVSRNILTKVEPDKLEPAINKIKKVIPKKTAIALGITMILGLSQQFINRYMTKKRTGSDAFVGLSEEAKKEAEADKKDKNKKIKLALAKAASVTVLLGLAASTLAWSVNPKTIWKTIGNKEKLLKKLEFNSKWPTLNQLRSVIYPAILIGRVLASSDKNELRETNTRDIPGFLNWLVLGGFVSKIVGKKISNGQLINTSAPKEGTNILNKIGHFLTKEHLVSHAEIDVKKITIQEAKEILSNAKKKIVATDAEKIILEAKKLLKWQLTKSIFAGIAYSTLALGVFVPMLNKHITNKLTTKKKNELQPSTPISQEKKPQDKPTSENITTLSFNSLNNDVFADFIKTQKQFKKA